MKKSLLYLFICYFMTTLHAQEKKTVNPVTPNASPEAVKLLNYIYSISGKKTLTGQHDQPLFEMAYYQRIYGITGSHPAIHGFDFGFSEPNTLDGINFRQRLVDDAINYWKDGTIITIMWHAVPPTREEPVTFHDAIQSKLTDEQWKEIVTPGTPLNLRWQSQVDVIAFFLKQLRDAHVPVIWRPYHEMNGPWFWWGAKPGKDGYIKLYRMLFNRLVNYHKLNNLIWVFDANEISPPRVDEYKKFYPGANYVDILATDVYHNDFAQADYDSLKKLAAGKPIALGEVGKLPTEEKLKEQPDWVWFMAWSDLVLSLNTVDEIKAIYSSDVTLTREERLAGQK